MNRPLVFRRALARLVLQKLRASVTSTDVSNLHGRAVSKSETVPSAPSPPAPLSPGGRGEHGAGGCPRAVISLYCIWFPCPMSSSVGFCTPLSPWGRGAGGEGPHRDGRRSNACQIPSAIASHSVNTSLRSGHAGALSHDRGFCSCPQRPSPLTPNPSPPRGEGDW